MISVGAQGLLSPGFGVDPLGFAANNGLQLTTGSGVPRGNEFMQYLGVPARANDSMTVGHSYSEFTPPEIKSTPVRMKEAIDMTIIGLSNGFEQFLLPIIVTDALNFVWNTWEFNAPLVDIVPHEGIPRIITSKKKAGSTSVIRRGLAFQMEADFFRTETGQRQFVDNCKGIQAAIQKTMSLDVMSEILNCKQVNATWQQKFGREQVSYYEIIQKEVDDYCPLIRSASQFDIMMEKGLAVMSGRRPDCLIVPPEFKIYMTKCQPENTEFWLTGPEGVRMKKDGPRSLSTMNGVHIFQCDPYQDGDGGSPPIQLLIKSSQVGERYNMFWPHRSDQLANWRFPYETRCRNLGIYSQNEDDFVTVTFAEAFNKAGIFSSSTENYSDTLRRFISSARHNNNLWRRGGPVSGEAPPFPLATFGTDGDRTSLRLMKIFGEFHPTQISSSDFDQVAQTILTPQVISSSVQSGLEVLHALMTEMEAAPFNKEFFDAVYVSANSFGYNEYGCIPLPATKPASVGVPPGYLSWAGLKTLATEASKPNSVWHDSGVRAREGVQAFATVVEHIRQILPNSYAFTLPVTNHHWFGAQASDAAARLFNSFLYVARLPLFYTVNAGGRATAAAAAAAGAGADSDGAAAVFDSRVEEAIVRAIREHKTEPNYVVLQLSYAFLAEERAFGDIPADAVRKSTFARVALGMNLFQLALFENILGSMQESSTESTPNAASEFLRALDARRLGPAQITNLLVALSSGQDLDFASADEMIQKLSQQQSKTKIPNAQRRLVYEASGLSVERAEAVITGQSSGAGAATAAVGAGGQQQGTSLPISVTPAMLSGIYRDGGGSYAVGDPRTGGTTPFQGQAESLASSPQMIRWDNLRSNLNAQAHGGRSLDHVALDIASIANMQAESSAARAAAMAAGAGFSRRGTEASMTTLFEIGARASKRTKVDEQQQQQYHHHHHQQQQQDDEEGLGDSEGIAINLVQHWIRETRNFVGNGVASQMRRVAGMVFMLAPCDTLACWRHLMDQNIHIPLNIMLARPWIEHSVGSAILMKSGSETGFTAFGQSNFTTSSDGVSKMLLGNYTFNCKSQVIEPRNVFIIDALKPYQYRGGNNAIFIDPEDVASRTCYNTADIGRPSIMSLVMSIRDGTNERPLNKFLDIFGRLPLPAAQEQIQRTNYATWQYYTMLYSEAAQVSGALSQRGSERFLDDDTRINSVVFQGGQFAYNPSTGTHNHHTVCNGHRGRDGSGPGAARVWDGADAMLPKQDWTTINIR